VEARDSGGMFYTKGYSLKVEFYVSAGGLVQSMNFVPFDGQSGNSVLWKWQSLKSQWSKLTCLNVTLLNLQLSKRLQEKLPFSIVQSLKVYPLKVWSSTLPLLRIYFPVMSGFFSAVSN